MAFPIACGVNGWPRSGPPIAVLFNSSSALNLTLLNIGSFGIATIPLSQTAERLQFCGDGQKVVASRE